MEHLHGELLVLKSYTKTIKLEKYAIRSIHKAAYNSCTNSFIFNKSQILRDLYEYESVLFMHDFVKNNLPHSFNNIFRYNRAKHPQNPQIRHDSGLTLLC